MVLTKEEECQAACITITVKVMFAAIIWTAVVFSYILWLKDTPIYENEIDDLKLRISHIEHNLTTIFKTLGNVMNTTRATDLN